MFKIEQKSTFSLLESSNLQIKTSSNQYIMKHIRDDYNLRIQDNANLIPENEPVMLFRAQDKHCAQVLRHYAWLLRQDGNEEMAEAVNNHLLEIEKWQSNVKRKRPDMPQLQKLEL